MGIAAISLEGQAAGFAKINYALGATANAEDVGGGTPESRTWSVHRWPAPQLAAPVIGPTSSSQSISFPLDTEGSYILRLTRVDNGRTSVAEVLLGVPDVYGVVYACAGVAPRHMKIVGYEVESQEEALYGHVRAGNNVLLDATLRAAMAATGVALTTRTATLPMNEAQAWTDIGLPIPLSAETTTFYELSLAVSWPAHTATVDGVPTAQAAKMVVRPMNIAVTRDATTGVVVVTDMDDCTSGTPWDVGNVLVRLVGDGANGWQIEAEHWSWPATTAVSARVTATIRTRVSRDWEDDATPTLYDRAWAYISSLSSTLSAFIASVVLSDDTPLELDYVGNPGIGAEFSRQDHVHAIGSTVRLLNGSGSCVINATTNGVAAQSLDVNCDNLGINAAGDCIVTVAAGYDVSVTGSATLTCGSGNSSTVSADTQVARSAAGAFGRTHTPASATTIVYGADIASISDTWTQDGSAAGGVRTLRGQRGFAGFVGGDLVIGPGDGGTTGTNLPGNLRLKLGTPVSNVTGKVIFEQEDGTNIMQMYRYAASSVLIRTALDSENLVLGGSSGPSGNSFSLIPNSYLTIGVNGGYLLVSSTTVYYEAAANKIFGAANVEESERRKTTTLTTATTVNLDTYGTPSNSTIAIDGEVMIRNNSDSLGIRIKLTGGLYRNDAGTITTLTAVTVEAAEGDATEIANITIAATWSTSTFQLVITTGNAKNRKVYSQLWIRNGV